MFIQIIVLLCMMFTIVSLVYIHHMPQQSEIHKQQPTINNFMDVINISCNFFLIIFNKILAQLHNTIIFFFT